MLVKIGEDQKSIDLLYKLPVTSSDSFIIVDPRGPSTVNSPKTTTTITIESNSNTQSTQVPVEAKNSQKSTISIKSNEGGARKNINDLDLNLNNINQFFDVLEENANQFKHFDFNLTKEGHNFDQASNPKDLPISSPQATNISLKTVKEFSNGQELSSQQPMVIALSEQPQVVVNQTQHSGTVSSVHRPVPILASQGEGNSAGKEELLGANMIEIKPKNPLSSQSISST